jgi:two-component system, cell cycle sensor histidine kinase and response regulator CckA
MLRKGGFCEASHTDPEKALTFFKANHERLGLAIVDLTMPKMTGLELSRHFLRIDPCVPIILITGYLMLPRDALTVPNVKTILAKPFTTAELKEIVEVFVPKQETEKDERKKRDYGKE